MNRFLTILTSTITSAEQMVLKKCQLDAIVAHTNGSAHAHVLHGDVVIKKVQLVEADLLARGVTKRNLAGTVVTIQSGGPGYGPVHRAPVTRFTAKRVRDGWRLVSFEKVYVWQSKLAERKIVISEAAAADIKKRAFEEISVA